MTNYKFIKRVLDENKYEEEHKKEIIDAIEKLIQNKDANKILESAKRDYNRGKNFCDFRDKVSLLKEVSGIHEYTLHLIILLSCAENLFKKYKAEGIDEEIFFDTMIDLKVKNLECVDNYGFCGTFVEGWFRGFYNMTRFKLGRFEYDLNDFDFSKYTIDGDTIEKGMFCLGMHIPSHLESLTEKVRLDSYKKAYNFFKNRFQTKYMYVLCSSWLLFPDNEKLLPKGSKTVEFLKDFDILQYSTKYDFGDQWRVFGVEHKDSLPQDLPRDTSMQRAFAEWLESGHKTGSGMGVIVFDGEKVLTRQK